MHAILRRELSKRAHKYRGKYHLFLNRRHTNLQLNCAGVEPALTDFKAPLQSA